jgi:uncharacterized membrane protein YsdA (DUF1294 family)
MAQRQKSRQQRPPQRQQRPPQRYSRRPPQRFNRQSPYTFYAAIAATGALGLALALVMLDQPLYIAWIAGWSVVTFAFYGFDKRRAQVGGPRVPELVLHLLSLIGGFVGGWLGLLYWRHKTLHPSFWLVLVFSSILHAGLAFWFLGDQSPVAFYVP